MFFSKTRCLQRQYSNVKNPTRDFISAKYRKEPFVITSLPTANFSRVINLHPKISVYTSPFTTNNKMSSDKVVKSEEEWKKVLSPDEYYVLRQKGTERPHVGQYTKCKDAGVYKCAGCGNDLYKSETKFDSGCGWPAFYEAIPGALITQEDSTHGMKRVEIMCAKCGGHMGHVFRGEGFATPTDERHCVNSICLKLEKK